MTAQTRYLRNIKFDQVVTHSLNPTYTANAMNVVYFQPGTASVSQGARPDSASPALDSQGTAVAGDILGQIFRAEDDNINGIALYGQNSNIANVNLRASLLSPASYSTAGVATFSGTKTLRTLDDNGTYKTSAQNYVVFANASFLTNATDLFVNIPMHYASNTRALTTIKTAVSAGDATIDVTSATNAIDNHNDMRGDYAKGEMMVVRKPDGTEYQFMIGGVTGTVISIVPYKYDAQGASGGSSVAFAVGDEVFFPLTVGNYYMLLLYGDAATSIITLKSKNTGSWYEYGGLATSTTGWDNITASSGTPTANLCFQVLSTPKYWKLDTLILRETSAVTHLDDMTVGCYRQDEQAREIIPLLGQTAIPDTQDTYSFVLDDDSSVFNRGEVAVAQVYANATTAGNLSFTSQVARYSQAGYLNTK